MASPIISSPQNPQTPARSPSAGSASTGSSRSGRYIDQQLRQTRRRVKMIDLFTALAVLGTSLFMALLALVLVDHWLVGFSVWGRWLILLVLLAGVSSYAVYCITNFLFRRINPKFAALMIEESAPTLKNSLINLLSFRLQPDGIRQVVYREMEQQAAADLTHVPVDTTVDRSKLIHISYFFLGVFVLCAAYIILSPKDPFQTLARIAAPWADIARPSRVRISNVQPGDQEFYYGQQATITAEVAGLGSADPVTLYFTTADRQLVDQAAAMRWDEAKQHYICVLPDARGGSAGLQQDLTYYLTAGDARTLDYHLRVTPSPTIFVQRIELQYPKYTSRPGQTLNRQGDVQALEGTRATIHARANQPIRSAFIEFDPEDLDAGNGNRAASLLRGQDRIRLKVEGNSAVGSFVLKLKSDHKTPEHTSYRIRFSNEKGMQNEQPFVHQIEVMRDLAPEVQILQPKNEVVEVPEDGMLTIETRAIDPDYGLSRVALIAENGAEELLDETLLKDAKGVAGQVVSTYQFVPRKLQLKAGDEVIYWAVAEDNRTAYESDRRQANLSQSRERRIKIVAGSGDASRNDPKREDENEPADSGKKQGQKGDSPQSDKPENQGDKQAEGGKGNNKKQQPGGKPDNKNQKDRNSQDRQPQKNQPPEKQQQEKQQGDMPPKDKPSQNQPPEKKQGGDKQQEQKQQQKPSDQKQQGKKQQEQGAKGSKGQEGGSKSRQNQNSQEGGGGQQKSGQKGEKQGGSQSSSGKGGDNQSSGGSQNSRDQNNAAGEQRSEKAHDGEVFEKVLEHLKKQGDAPQEKGEQKSQDSNQSGANKKPEKDSQNDASGNPRQSPMPQGGRGEAKKDSQSGQNKSQENGKSPRQAMGQKTSDASKKGTPDKEQKPGQGEKKEQMEEKPDAEQEGDKNTPANKKVQGNQDQTSSRAGRKKKGSSNVNQNDFKNKVQPKNNSTPSAAKKSAPEKEDNQSGKPRNDKEDKPQGYNEKEKKAKRTKGGEDGDKTGDGKEGAGQNAKRAGDGVAGGGQSSDQGASGAKDTGPGDTSKSAGDKERAEGKTGAKGSEKGKGSSRKANPQGKQKGEGAPQGEPQENDSPAGNQPKSKSGKPRQSGKSRAPGNSPLGGGGKPDPNKSQSRETPLEGEVPAGEKANLDYARKATDLVLKRLGEQEDDPDQELLDDLGWSEADLQRFLARWRKMKASAVEDDASNRKLERTLRSLGLRSDRDALLKGGQNVDRRGSLSNSGDSSKPPSSFLEKFNAYKKGAARAASGR